MAEIAAARKKFEDQNDEYYKIGLSYTDAVHPAVIARELGDFLYRGKLPKEQTTVASGGYGIARYVRRELRGYRPGQIMNGAYQYGAIGPDVGYAVGVAAAVQLGVGVQRRLQGPPDHLHHRRRRLRLHGHGNRHDGEVPAAGHRHRLQQQRVGHLDAGAAEPRALPIHLFQENLRYDKLAEALGGHGEYVTRPADFRPALERAYEVAVKEGRPSVINCQGKKEFWDRRSSRPARSARSSPA